MMASEFCELALKEVRVLGTGRAMTSEQSTDVLRRLNSMLSNWSADDLVIPYRTRESLTLTAGVNPHTIGSGGTLNTTQPTDIHSLVIVSDSTNYPLTQVSVDHLDRFSSVAGMPRQFSYERGLTTGSIYFDRAPDQAYSVFLRTLKALTGFAALTTEDDLPNEYEEAIVTNLAVRIAPMFNKEPSQATVEVARTSLDNIRRNVSANRVPTLEVPVELRPGAGNFNIDTYE